MVALGRANTRMTDFYDIWVLAQLGRFDDDRLARAIAATFARRHTAIQIDVPDALTPAFAADASKRRQWAVFLRDVAIKSRLSCRRERTIGDTPDAPRRQSSLTAI